MVFEADVGVRRGGAAVAAKIDTDHAKVGRKRSDLRLPHRVIEGQAMHKEKRWLVTAGIGKENVFAADFGHCDPRFASLARPWRDVSLATRWRFQKREQGWHG